MVMLYFWSAQQFTVILPTLQTHYIQPFCKQNTLYNKNCKLKGFFLKTILNVRAMSVSKWIFLKYSSLCTKCHPILHSSSSREKSINVPRLEKRAEFPEFTNVTTKVTVICPQSSLWLLVWLQIFDADFQEDCQTRLRIISLNMNFMQKKSGV